jgi:uncharacterized membrane protein
MNDREKLLKLMRFWLFGTFVIVFVAITIYIGYIALLLGGNWVDALTAGFPIWGITAVLCVITYFLYVWISGRKK